MSIERVAELEGLLAQAISELEGLPSSYGYEFTTLPSLRAALSPDHQASAQPAPVAVPEWLKDPESFRDRMHEAGYRGIADAQGTGAEVMRLELLSAAPQPPVQQAKFQLGDPVRKIKGSRWQGRVVGTYSTELTPEGYAVESDTEHGSVQIYPAAALELCPEEAQAPASETALAFRYHREVHTSELREFISDAYELSAQQPEPTKCATCGQPTKFDKPFCEEHSYEPLPAPAQDEREAGLEAWAKGKFSYGKFIGQLCGNTDWALARKVWSAAVDYARTRPAQTEQQPVAWADAQQLKALVRDCSASCAVWNSQGRSRVPLYAAPIAQTAPSKVDHTLDQRMIDHFTCRREDNVRGVEGFTLYFTKMGAHHEYQLYRNEAEALHYNLGRALGVAAPSQPEQSEVQRLREALEKIAKISGDSIHYHPSYMSRIARSALDPKGFDPVEASMRSALSAHRAQQEGE